MKVLILAAGKGKRLNTDGNCLPKVLHPLCGRPLISYVTEKLQDLDKKDICVVVGYGKEQVMSTLPGYRFAEQTEQLGTGHAVMAARSFLEEGGSDVLVLYGDMPMFHAQTYRNLMQKHLASGADATLLTCDCRDRHLAYGRVLRDADGALRDIVEERDCTPAQKALTELNVGVYVFKIAPMLKYLDLLRCNNVQGEYYLTDLPKIMMNHGCLLETHMTSDTSEIIGINTTKDLAQCEQILEQKKSAIKQDH